ncbi:hypothetical protein BGW38_004649 [Lunasporangiospora selenospora]|uniref:PB1 domain-containing protein n=1 Tax=Lunasporangiospora selenospora TaxID=979761 RepID=A0A9P6KBV7_9FUNG|nr:hypothetical protein BGW38_004649 [Lunasporangiospora selenospora]
MRDLWRASREKQTKAHDVLDQALRDRGQDCTVFTIPEGVLYRPSETKVKNAKKKDYLGNSKVIAAVDASDQFAGFKGKSAWQVQMSGPTNITPIEQPRPMTPPNGLQRRATERILNHGNGIERPHMLEHSASFSGSEGLPRRAGAGSSPSPLGHGNLGVPPSIEAKSLKRRNTEKRPAALNTSFDGNNGPRSGGGPISSTPSSTMYSGHGSNGGGGRSHFQDELDEIEEQVYALSMETGRSFGGVSDGMNSVGASPTTIGTGMVVPNTGIMGLARSNTMLSTTPNGVRPTIDRMQSQKKQISPPGSNYTSPVMSGAGSNGKMNGGGVSPPGQSRQVPGFSDLRRVGSSAGGGLMRGNSVRSAISSPSTVASPRAYGGASSRIEEGSIMEEPILKIRVKCHYIDTRAVLVRVDTPLQELLQRIQEKFQSDRPLKLKYKDEDLHMLSMIDDEDWTMALQVHQATTGSPDRMELWCYDDE